ncbi:MAG: hypothetical protein JST66_06125 [Bacteroidetes bacterium]|nr:hypothetical protein [Bacteroidota bacterium]
MTDLSAFSSYIELMSGVNFAFSVSEVRAAAVHWADRWFSDADMAAKEGRMNEVRDDAQGLSEQRMAATKALSERWVTRSRELFDTPFVRQAFVATGLFGAGLLFFIGAVDSQFIEPATFRRLVVYNSIVLVAYLLYVNFLAYTGPGRSVVNSPVAFIGGIPALLFVELFVHQMFPPSELDGALTEGWVLVSMGLLVTSYVILFIRMLCMSHAIAKDLLEDKKHHDEHFGADATAGRPGLKG